MANYCVSWQSNMLYKNFSKRVEAISFARTLISQNERPTVMQFNGNITHFIERSAY